MCLSRLVSSSSPIAAVFVFCGFLTSTASVDVANISRIKSALQPILAPVRRDSDKQWLYEIPCTEKCSCVFRVDSTKDAMRVRAARHLTASECERRVTWPYREEEGEL